MNASIRVPSGAKREPNVSRFKTLRETRVDHVVVTLEALYIATAKLFSAKRIGEAVELSDLQTLIYLPMRHAGAYQSCTDPQSKLDQRLGLGSVDVPASPLDHGAKLAAETSRHFRRQIAKFSLREDRIQSK